MMMMMMLMMSGVADSRDGESCNDDGCSDGLCVTLSCLRFFKLQRNPRL